MRTFEGKKCGTCDYCVEYLGDMIPESLCLAEGVSRWAYCREARAEESTPEYRAAKKPLCGPKGFLWKRGPSDSASRKISRLCRTCGSQFVMYSYNKYANCKVCRGAV